MTNSRKNKKFKNTLHRGTLVFQALNDVEKRSKMPFLNENVEFQWVWDVLRTRALWAISFRFFPNAGPTGFENSKKSHERWEKHVM